LFTIHWTNIRNKFYLTHLIQHSTFNFIEFILPYQEYFIENSFLLKINELVVIRNIILYNSPEDKLITVEDKNTERISFSIRFDSESYSVKNCGLIEKEQFVVNENSYFESKNYNSCLNRKVCIDSNGEIKNCPSMVKSFGNIENLTIIDAINISGFKDLWVINKNQIEVCKDCEFRHICTDCRAFIEDPNNIYSKPAKCSYDPYTATWGDENPTNNPLYGQ
jgi:SPASM domain peptide maturase of grasp-with-spasm system